MPHSPTFNALEVKGELGFRLEPRFETLQPQGRFSRAIRKRQLQQAIYAAHELDVVTLENALELTILAAEVG